MLAILLVAPLLAQQAEAPKPAPEQPEGPPPKPVLAYAGKPLAVPVACSEEDIEGFGLTCTPEVPCEVYLELSAAEPLGNKLFLSGNLHTSSSTLWSILLASEDGGRTWTEAHERIRSAGLEQIQFVDFENGWIGGQTLVALPRNPFFLRTTDGGKSWRQIAVSSEPRVGAIEQFNFENKTTGSLLIDRTQSGESGGRHEYYETSTGGDSWMVREISPQPLKLKRPRVPTEGWRVRADGVSKSFRVEKRAGAKWDTVAAFLIRAGECRPAELKFAEPPPEQPTPTTGAVTELAPYGRRPPPTLKKKKK
jgi:hypothetical protein